VVPLRRLLVNGLWLPCLLLFEAAPASAAHREVSLGQRKRFADEHTLRCRNHLRIVQAFAWCGGRRLGSCFGFEESRDETAALGADIQVSQQLAPALLAELSLHLLQNQAFVGTSHAGYPLALHRRPSQGVGLARLILCEL
jgi:hypothetical protein